MELAWYGGSKGLTGDSGDALDTSVGEAGQAQFDHADDGGRRQHEPQAFEQRLSASDAGVGGSTGMDGVSGGGGGSAGYVEGQGAAASGHDGADGSGSTASALDCEREEEEEEEQEEGDEEVEAVSDQVSLEGAGGDMEVGHQSSAPSSPTTIPSTVAAAADDQGGEGSGGVTAAGAARSGSSQHPHPGRKRLETVVSELEGLEAELEVVHVLRFRSEAERLIQELAIGEGVCALHLHAPFDIDMLCER
jgi:hypothetical protein